MIPALERRAEVIKLARLLNTDADELAALEDVPPEDLRELRETITSRLFDGHVGAFRRAVHASGILPTGVSATIAEKAMGPLLCARLAGLVPTERAIGVAAHLSPDFLTEVAINMDPRRASDVIAGISAERIEEIARRLADRGEHVVMGRFAGHLSDDTLRRTFAALDDSDLLHIAFVLEEGLDRAVSLMPNERLIGVLRCAAEEDLWPEAVAMLDDLAPERRLELTRMVAGDAQLKRSLLAAADREGLGDEARRLLKEAA